MKHTFILASNFLENTFSIMIQWLMYTNYMQSKSILRIKLQAIGCISSVYVKDAGSKAMIGKN